MLPGSPGSDYFGSAGQRGAGNILGKEDLAFERAGGDGIDPVDSQKFLHALGRDKDSHAIMSNAQEVLTASRIHHAEGTSDVQAAAEIGARGHGVLDQGRSEEMSREGQLDSDELKESANWKKGGAGVAVYGATGAIGGFAGPAAQIAVPLLTGAAGSAATSEINASIDSDVATQEARDSGKIYSDIKDFENQAELNATDAFRRKMEVDNPGTNGWRDKEDEVAAAYQLGKDRSESPHGAGGDQ